jgi:hypothetical protein
MNSQFYPRDGVKIEGLLNFVSIPRRRSALKMSFPDALPEWSPLSGSNSRTHSFKSQLSSIQKATVPVNA